jgi:hypothetical protein
MELRSPPAADPAKAEPRKRADCSRTPNPPACACVLPASSQSAMAAAPIRIDWCVSLRTASSVRLYANRWLDAAFHSWVHRAGIAAFVRECVMVIRVEARMSLETAFHVHSSATSRENWCGEATVSRLIVVRQLAKIRRVHHHVRPKAGLCSAKDVSGSTARQSFACGLDKRGQVSSRQGPAEVRCM